MKTTILGLLLFATFIYRSDATVGITVVSGATTVLALTATQDIDILRKFVTGLPGRYQTAHLVGQQSGPEKCVTTYDCSLTVPDIVTFLILCKCFLWIFKQICNFQKS